MFIWISRIGIYFVVFNSIWNRIGDPIIITLSLRRWKYWLSFSSCSLLSISVTKCERNIFHHYEWIQRFRFKHRTFGQIVDDFSFYHKNEFKPISRIEKCKCDDDIRIENAEQVHSINFSLFIVYDDDDSVSSSRSSRLSRRGVLFSWFTVPLNSVFIPHSSIAASHNMQISISRTNVFGSLRDYDFIRWSGGMMLMECDLFTDFWFGFLSQKKTVSFHRFTVSNYVIVYDSFVNYYLYWLCEYPAISRGSRWCSRNATLNDRSFAFFHNYDFTYPIRPIAFRECFGFYVFIIQSIRTIYMILAVNF